MNKDFAFPDENPVGMEQDSDERAFLMLYDIDDILDRDDSDEYGERRM